jgi:hypothetical protein
MVIILKPKSFNAQILELKLTKSQQAKVDKFREENNLPPDYQDFMYTEFFNESQKK